MAFPRLKQFAEKKGWTLEKDCAYGEENGYLFTVADAPGFKMFLTPVPSVTDEEKDKILNFLAESKDQLKIEESVFDNKVLVVKFKETFKSTKIETMENYISVITGFLRQINVIGKNYCAFCCKDGAFEKVYVDGICYYAHNECYTNAVVQVEKAIEEFDTEGKNYISGFLGALVGGIISSIPWIFVQVFFERMAGFLAFLVGLGAAKSYTFFKGKLGKYTRWIVAVSVVISTSIAQFIILDISLVENGKSPTISNFQLLFSNRESLNAIKADFGMALFMAFLGIVPLFFDLKGKGKNVMPVIKK